LDNKVIVCDNASFVIPLLLSYCKLPDIRLTHSVSLVKFTPFFCFIMLYRSRNHPQNQETEICR